jgi:hypothetical protein
MSFVDFFSVLGLKWLENGCFGKTITSLDFSATFVVVEF